MGCPICDNKAANCDCTATEREQFDEIESLQAEIARLREERRWVSVGERLPEGLSMVLAFINGEVMEATFVGGKVLAWKTERGGFYATHWMPLPPGPETKEVPLD
jgi:hypothetical protein